MPDQLWQTVLPTLPSWTLWPIVIVGVLLFVWPKVRDVWQDVVPTQRQLKKLKLALELEKLLREFQVLQESSKLRNRDDHLRLLICETEQLSATLVSAKKDDQRQNLPVSNAKRVDSAYVSLITGGIIIAVGIIPDWNILVELIQDRFLFVMLVLSVIMIVMYVAGYCAVWLIQIFRRSEISTITAIMVGTVSALFVSSLPTAARLLLGVVGVNTPWM